MVLSLRRVYNDWSDYFLSMIVLLEVVLVSFNLTETDGKYTFYILAFACMELGSVSTTCMNGEKETRGTAVVRFVCYAGEERPEWAMDLCTVVGPWSG
jgi:hypothetical protein